MAGLMKSLTKNQGIVSGFRTIVLPNFKRIRITSRMRTLSTNILSVSANNARITPVEAYTGLYGGYFAQ
jgi:hypothetical protein